MDVRLLRHREAGPRPRREPRRAARSRRLQAGGLSSPARQPRAYALDEQNASVGLSFPLSRVGFRACYTRLMKRPSRVSICRTSPILDERGNLHFDAGLQRGGLRRVSGRVALEAGLGVRDLEARRTSRSSMLISSSPAYSSDASSFSFEPPSRHRRRFQSDGHLLERVVVHEVEIGTRRCRGTAASSSPRRTDSTLTPALNVLSMMRPVLMSRSFVRTKALPLPGFTCWNSTMVHACR